MLKEIIDIGRTSNSLGSVFTTKNIVPYYVNIDIKLQNNNFNLLSKHIEVTNEQEFFIKSGVHRGKKGSTLYFFPTSFIVSRKELQKEKNKLIQKLKKGYQKITKIFKEKNENMLFLEKLSHFLLDNIDDILAECKNCFIKIDSEIKDKKNENIAVIVQIHEENNSYFISDKKELVEIFQEVEFHSLADKFKVGKGKEKKQAIGKCNMLNKQAELYYPNGGFYYPFSTDKSNVKYNLTDEKNLFILSKQAFVYFMTGKTYLESFHEFYFMGLRSYITITALDDEVLQEFNKYIRESKHNISEFIGLIDKINDKATKRKALINFYFFELASTGGGKEIIEFIKDIIPTNLVQNVRYFEKLVDYFSQPTSFATEFKKYKWQLQIFNIYYKDSHKKLRTALFRKIALNEFIELSQLYIYMNNKMQYGINKGDSDKYRYYFHDAMRNFIFLNWIDTINKGENTMLSQELILGDTYKEKLSYFLQQTNLLKESSSMKVGVCLGLMIDILSWEINGYDKKTLSHASKKIERGNLNSLQIFVNEVFAKTQFHTFGGLQTTNIEFATQEVLNLTNKSFEKDEFVFGLFLGNELYNSVKSKKDPNKPNNEDEKLIQGEESE